MLTEFFIYAGIIGYFGITIYVANQDQLTNRQSVRGLLYAAVGLIGLLGFYVLALSSADPQSMEPPLPEISATIVLASVAIAGISALLSLFVINSYAVRSFISQRLVAGRGTFDPASVVHTTAIVLTFLLVVGTILPFLASGGAEAMAETIEAEGISLQLPVLQAFVQVLAALLGVGFAIRRTWPAAMERLGLRVPTLQDFRVGVVTAMVLLGILYVFNTAVLIIQQPDILTNPEQLGEETTGEAAQELAEAFATPLAALVLATSASVGEEIFFRGALQPVFGNVLTSIVFALLHTQVFISPGLILLFIVSLGFGIVRKRYSTTAAIIAHFVYNFVQLALLILISGSV